MFLYDTVPGSSAVLGTKEGADRRIKRSIMQTSQTKHKCEGHLLFESTFEISFGTAPKF